MLWAAELTAVSWILKSTANAADTSTVLVVSRFLMTRLVLPAS